MDVNPAPDVDTSTSDAKEALLGDRWRAGPALMTNLRVAELGPKRGQKETQLFEQQNFSCFHKYHRQWRKTMFVKLNSYLCLAPLALCSFVRGGTTATVRLEFGVLAAPHHALRMIGD